MSDLRLAIRISLIYAVIGCAWIVASDWVSFTFADVVPAYLSATVKGLGFVLVTSALLFWLVRRNTKMLCESEARFRLLIENAPDAVMVAAQNRIVYVNKTLLSLVGAEDVRNFLGHDIAELIQGAALKAVRQRLTQVEQLKVPLMAQSVSFQRADGTAVVCEVSAVPVKYGQEEGALIFIRDTTERTKAHERQFDSQQMESIKKLAGGLAHDLNNLLQVINGYTDLACEAVEEGHEVRNYLQQIRASGKRASEVIHKLLSFSRRKDPNEKWVDLSGTQVIPKRWLPQEPAPAARPAPPPAPPAPAAPPAPSQSEAALKAAAPGKPQEGGGAILIAEDDEMVRNLSVRILKRDGYAVIEAGDGDEAVRLFQDNARRIGVVILDVVMPHVDGFQAYERIREIDSKVPILFASGYSAIESPANVSLEPGVNLLQKPFDVEALLSTVHRVSRRSVSAASA